MCCVCVCYYTGFPLIAGAEALGIVTVEDVIERYIAVMCIALLILHYVCMCIMSVCVD